MFKQVYMQFLLSVMVLILGLSLAPVGGQALAQDLPPGVTVEVIADYGSPGIPYPLRGCAARPKSFALVAIVAGRPQSLQATVRCGELRFPPHRARGSHTLTGTLQRHGTIPARANAQRRGAAGLPGYFPAGATAP